MKTIFKKTQNGYWAQVGDNGRQFETTDFGDNWETTHNAAQKFYITELEFQHPAKSLAIVSGSASRLQLLVDRVRDSFPVLGGDYGYMVDDHRDALAVAFGVMVVTESDEGFNIEVVTNWLKKTTVTVCTGVSLDVAAAVVMNSESSRNFRDIDPRRLHLSDFNREMLHALCGAK